MILLKMNEMIRIQNNLLILITTTKNSTLEAAAFNEWMDGQDVMNLLHISARTLGRLRNNGQLPSYKLNGKIFYKKADMEQLLQTHKTT
jgi:hypothetical protein